MLWRTHLRISFEVLERLEIDLSPQVKQKFRDGIIAPDQWKDYPHHYGKSDKIRQYIMKARKCFLQDHCPDAFFNLGVALHYIQDSHTSFASFYPKHHSWEESIDNSYFASDLIRTINICLKDKAGEKKRCLRLAQELSKNTLGRDNTLYLATLSGHEQSKSFAKPAVDLNLALRASYVVSKAVLSPKKCVILENRLSKKFSNYQVMMQAAEEKVVDKITILVEDKENLQTQKVLISGFVSKIKNGILSIRIKLKEWSVNSKYKDYRKKKHLKKVINDYYNSARNIVNPHQRWNLFQIPELNSNMVKKELLTAKEVTETFAVNKSNLTELLDNVPSYVVGNMPLVKRAEIINFRGNKSGRQLVVIKN